MRWFRSRSGQGTVEMALVAPILIWVLVGVVDMARLASAYMIVEHAAREGLRLGMVGASDTQVVDRAKQAASTLDLTALTVTVTPAGSRTSGSQMTVTVDYQYKVLSLMGIIGNQVDVTGVLTARVE